MHLQSLYSGLKKNNFKHIWNLFFLYKIIYVHYLNMLHKPLNFFFLKGYEVGILFCCTQNFYVNFLTFIMNKRKQEASGPSRAREK